MFNIHNAIEDFRQARRQARLEDFFSRFSGESTELLSYDTVRRLLQANQQIDRGLQEIPLDAIVGSVGRYQDFTRTFLPKTDSDESRWTQVKMAQYEKGLPPIEVYQIGDVYFVQDGNHRVSIARQDGNSRIEAYVTEVHTDVALTPDTELDELILRAEYAEFLRQTKIHLLRPNANLNLTSPGNYPLLLEHIKVHRYFMGVAEQREVSHSEAVTHWYDTVFQPAVQMIREQGLLAGFPERTAADLYIWLAAHRAELEDALGWAISTPTAVSALTDAIAPEQPAGLLNRALQTVTGQTPQRHNEWWIQQYLQTADSHLFATILLPLHPADSGWHVVEQARLWAIREGSQLIGLHGVAEPAHQTGLVAQTMAAHFQQKVMGVARQTLFKAEVGDLETLTPRLARWADLVALAIPTADSPYWETMQQTRGLMLLVPPQPATPITSVLLVHDTSPYALEALFVAAYLQRDWDVALTIISRADNAEQATADLEKYELTADLVTHPELTSEFIHETVSMRRCQLIVLGGYTTSRGFRQRRDWLDALIAETAIPLLLCR